MDFLAVVTSISTSPKCELQSLDWLFLGEIYEQFSHGFSLLKYIGVFSVNILNHPSDSKMGDDEKWILTWFNHLFHHPSDSKPAQVRGERPQSGTRWRPAGAT